MCFWSCLVIFDHFVVVLCVVDHVWSCLIMFDRVWLCLIMFGHVWSCLIMFGHVWSLLRFLVMLLWYSVCLIIFYFDHGLMIFDNFVMILLLSFLNNCWSLWSFWLFCYDIVFVWSCLIMADHFVMILCCLDHIW